MTLSDLDADTLARRLREGEVAFHCGPFVVRVASSLPVIAQGLGLLYADYPLTSGFADYRLDLMPPPGLRRWLRPQVEFSIAGDRPFAPFPADQAYPLFEWSLNWCIVTTSHRFLIVHAAVVERHGRAVVMPGQPGAGKSTLTAALVSRGWRLFSDELTLIAVEGGHVVPLPRPISLKNQSIDVIRRFAPSEVFNRATHNTMKGSIAHMRVPTDHVRRANEPALPGSIVFPAYEVNAAAALVPRARPDTLLELARNAFNYRILGRTGFEILCEFVERSACYDLRYGRLDDAIALFDRLEFDRAP